MISKNKTLLIIDGNSLIHRAYHALPKLTTKEGEFINAIYGFLLIFLRFIKEFQPDFVVACFDLPLPTFRHKKFKEYKIKRPTTPLDLSQQIPKVKEVLNSFNVPVFEKEGFEADDLMGTIVETVSKNNKESKEKIEIIIISGDLDSLQLINSWTRVINFKKGIKETVLYNKESLKEKYGNLKPLQLIEFKALRGDPSDGIPGVKGVGEKTAVFLIEKFGSIDNLYKNLEKNKIIAPNLKKTLLKDKKMAFFSKFLAEINKNVPINFNLENCKWGNFEEKDVIEIFGRWEFKSLIKKIEEFKPKLVKENLRLW